MEVPTEPKFLPFMCRLRSLKICVRPKFENIRHFKNLSFILRSLFASLTSPATLEHIKLSIWLFASNDRFDYSGFYRKLRVAGVCDLLDDFSTRPTGSQLGRVDIDIIYSDANVMELDKLEDEIALPMLRALPSLSKKRILSVNAMSDISWMARCI
jgi:hypothetical protein